MRIAGWIFVIIGGLSLIGSIAGGNSAFGPLFWLGLGITLVCLANRKKNNKEEETKKHSLAHDSRRYPQKDEIQRENRD